MEPHRKNHSEQNTKTNHPQKNFPWKKFAVIGVLLLLLLFFFRYENNHLVISSYEYRNEKITEDLNHFRIVQISDLHNASFGRNNEQLIQKVLELDPNLVVLTGDVVDSSHTDLSVAFQLIEQLTSVCPVYYVTGNHENWLSEQERTELLDGMKENGAILLENEAVLISSGNDAFYLIGLDDNHLADDTLLTLMETCEDERLSIVLAHEPQYLSRYSGAGADLVFSGHAHGGQFILPFLGPVVAPDQGFFPAYTEGAYQQGTTTMYVSRGLGNSIIPVRLFNDPEIVCIDLMQP